MFKKRGQNEQETASREEAVTEKAGLPAGEQRTQSAQRSTNRILKGNRLIGNISVTCDLDLSGEIEGDITSEQDSNITVRGLCRGSIHTKGGSVEIEGELREGNITAGSDVHIMGKFNGGEIKAKGCIRINGSFSGRLEASTIEMGPASSGSGEILYKEHILIERGAQVEGQISKMPAELTLVKRSETAKGPEAAAPEKKAGQSS